MFKCLEFLLEIAAFTILFSNNAWTANIGLRLYFIYDLICVLMTLSICCNLKENVSYKPYPSFSAQIHKK